MDSRNHCALFVFKSTVNTYIQKKIGIIFRSQFPQKNFGDYAFFSWNPRISLWHLFSPPCIIHVDFFVLPLIPFSFFHYKHSELKKFPQTISEIESVFHSCISRVFLVAYGKNSWNPFSRNFCTILLIFN